MNRISLGTSRAPYPSAISRAIRLALATSAAALALAGSGLATAACSYTDATTVTCAAGAYNLGLPDGAFVPVSDLTLVLDPGVTVAPGAFVTGVDASWGGAVSVSSHADITTYLADGVNEYSSTSAYLFNAGNITSYGGGSYSAVDISAAGNVTLVNAGTLSAYAYGGNNVDTVRAVSSLGDIGITLADTSVIDANSAANYTWGFFARASGYDGNVTIDNSGSITASGLYHVYGVRVRTVGDYGDIGITLADTSLIAANSIAGDAIGIKADTLGLDGNLTIDSSGSISASSVYGIAFGVIVLTVGDFGDIDITLADTSQIVANSIAYDAIGIGAETVGLDGNLTIDNAGSISATAYGLVFGVRVSAFGPSGDIGITLADTSVIDANSDYGYAQGIDARTYGYDGNVTIDNAGSIAAASLYGTATGVGARTSGVSGDIGITLADTSVIDANSASLSATGIDARTFGYDGNVTIGNAGSISAAAYTVAVGMSASTVGDSGDIGITLAATSVIDANSTTGTATGISASSRGYGGNVTIDNAGSISASSLYGDALGVRASTRGDFGDIGITLADTSLIYATSYAPYVRGIYARTRGLDADVTIYNAGSISAIGHENGTPLGAQAIGVGASARGDYGDIGITLADTSVIYAYTVSFDAFGLTAATSGYDGNVSIDNAGSISATATGYAYAAYGYYYGNAFGVAAQTGGDSGDIDITLADTSVIDAISTNGQVKGLFASTAGLDGNVTIDNAGSISASSLSGIITALGAYNSAYGVEVRTFGNFGNISITLADTSVIDANSTDGPARGIWAGTIGLDGNVTFDNAGSISASSLSNSAIGVDVLTSGALGDIGITLADTSVIDANSAAGYAGGIFAEAFSFGSGNVTIDNAGSVSATAAYGVATGIRAKSLNGLASVTNSATGNITATGADTATGIFVSGYYGASVDNAGDISATADGNAFAVYAHTTGLTGDILISNSGDITASTSTSASGYVAVGVYLLSDTVTTLYNSGTITADIAVLTAYSNDTIYNSGTITGAIVTGGGDDTLYNAVGGIWNAVGSSDFGSGDDAIFNAGTINMTDASIDLGIDPAGNQFVNDGTITVSGDNIIDMGTGADLITPNPYPFYNNGTIDFQDGAPDDVLTIVSDFAGVGDINVDVSALNAASDLLYIEGSVIDGSVSTINVNMLDLPDSPVVEVPMVLVTGTSSPDDFVLGDVVYNPDNFVTLAFDLVSGTSNGNDSYSLRVAMDGLSDAGKLGAVISPGVQLLLRDQVGTWAQRSNGLPQEGQSKFSLWARVFHNHGVVRPESGASFGSDGGLAFDLDTSGGETGLNYAGSQRFNFGLILGHSELRQNLRDGIGNDTIKGNVYGGYGTMNLPGGFYLDLSHRRLKFDAVLDAATGELRSGGEAETSNMESGFTWHWKNNLGLQVQFQQTRTRVTSIDSLSGASVVFDADGGGSSVTRLAAELRKVYKPTASGTVWLSRVILHAVRESDGDSHYAIGNDVTGHASLQGTSFKLEAGASAQRGSLLFFGSVVYENGGPLHNFVGAQLGARYVW